MNTKTQPLYDSQDYKDFCEKQIEKGLHKDYHDLLPEMWGEELEFREELEESLNKFVNQEV